MVDPTTPNLVLAQPLRASNVGTWDTPVNNNTGVIDQAFGGVTTISLSSADVTLTSSQAQAAVLRLTGTLTNNVIVNLPSIYKGWTIDNQLTNNLSSFAARIMSTSATFTIGVAPGVNDIFYDSSSVKYRNLGRVGEYWDYAGSGVPTWVSLCTVPPYLNCNGSAFSSATYPILANLLGVNTLPDARGRFRATINQGTGRITTAISSVDGDTVAAAGSSQTKTLATANLPPYTPAGTGFATAPNGQNYATATSVGSINTTAGGSPFFLGPIANASQATITFNGTAQGGTSTPLSVIGPTYMGGITMIRAA